MNQKLYTQEEVDIKLLNSKNDNFEKSLERIERYLGRLDSKLDSRCIWLLGLMGTGFLGILSLMAHGFNWIR